MQRRILRLSAVMLGLVGATGMAMAASVAPPGALNMGSGDILRVSHLDRDLGRETAAERRRINQHGSREFDRPRGGDRDRDFWEDRELGRQTAAERRRMNQYDSWASDYPRYRYRDRDYWDDRELGRQSAGERRRMNQYQYPDWEYE